MRYVLRDLDYFQRTMKTPGRGVPYTVRDLADASGVSRSQIGRLLTGDLDNLDVNDAHAIAEALGVAVLVLFMPPVSPEQGHHDIAVSPTRRST
ncbi:helix-turn-helix transcriptional regulator [Streptomyces sp. ID-01-6.2a]|uniref:Helix-turn-helix transcriptional regulator n=2 Tax=Streptomyces caniscabiei TaxID=2746961 RepID=A0A927KZ12_9ACTN|nr:helix-turn-helix transcriptional regulator [Streptomyces caniscabiei]